MPELNPDEVQDILMLAGTINRDISEFQNKTDAASQNLQYNKITPQQVLQGVQVKGRPITAPSAPVEVPPMASVDGLPVSPPKPFIPLVEAFGNMHPPSTPAPTSQPVQSQPENTDKNQLEFHFAKIPKTMQDAIDTINYNQAKIALDIESLKKKLLEIETLLGEVLTKRRKRQEYVNGTETDKL